MSATPYDAVLILGKSLNDDGTVPAPDKIRLDRAAEAYASGQVSAVIPCGSHGYKNVNDITVTEAEAYAAYLEGKGVPRRDVYLEDESQETLGNILFAKMQLLIPHGWRRLLVIPTVQHSEERIAYLLQKILGETYTWELLHTDIVADESNRQREQKALELTREINDVFADGDHDAIYAGLMETHPAYGGTKWTMDELRQEMKH